MLNQSSRRAILLAAAELAIAHATYAAQTYTDSPTDRFSSGPEVDIDHVVVSNDALNLNFQINMNSSADIGTNYYASYEVGIQVGNGAGGQTAINGGFALGDPTVGDPYGSAVGISTGENFFIGSYLGDAGMTYNGGAELFQYSASTGWAKVGSTAPITEVRTGTPSTSFSIPISALGLNAGDSFKFDVWTTFPGGGQSAYDALGGTTYPAGYFPYSNGAGTPTPYDSATTLSTYTLASIITGSIWTGATDGNWSGGGGSNWTGGIPNATDATANFVTNLSGHYAVALDAAGDTVGAMNFNSATSYTIGSVAGASLTFSVSTGMAGITVISGSHTIAAPLNLMSDASITMGNAAMLAITSPIIAPARTIDKSGPGTLQIQRIQATLLDVMGGTAQVAQHASPNSAAGTSVLANLFVEAGGSFDTTNNALILTGGTTADVVRQMILSGRITTSLNTGNHALGYADNAVLGRTTFGGISGVSATSILVGYTFAGDSNLDGRVNAVDFNALATNYGGSSPLEWTQGDFNYDGVVDTTDFTLLGTAFGSSEASPSSSLGTLVPEPCTATMLATGAAFLTIRRRSKGAVRS